MTTTAQTLDTNPPRSGRELIGRYSWLLRLADKVRADHAGTAGEYIAYCGLSMGFLERAGVSKEAFDDLITDGATDADLQKYFDRHVDDAHRRRLIPTSSSSRKRTSTSKTSKKGARAKDARLDTGVVSHYYTD